MIKPAEDKKMCFFNTITDGGPDNTL